MRHIHQTVSQITISGSLKFSFTELKVPTGAIVKFVLLPLKKWEGIPKTKTCL